ncbi:MAG: hypothetical protein Q7S21_04670 [archaeon]|nr:hypothetical protein [archaeon]
MKERTLTITKKGKVEEEIDWKLVNKFRRAIDDVKHGRIKQWKPKTK